VPQIDNRGGTMMDDVSGVLKEVWEKLKPWFENSNKQRSEDEDAEFIRLLFEIVKYDDMMRQQNMSGQGGGDNGIPKQ